MGDRTEPAIARAMISQDDEGGRTTGKALPKVGAMGFLTNRVKAPFFEDPVNLPVSGAGRDPSFKPWGFAGMNVVGRIHHRFTLFP
jgi:hypothetical protein